MTADDPRIRNGMVRQLAARRQMLDEGATHVGWKVGFGAPSSLELMHISAPLVGFLTDATVFDSEAVIDPSDWQRGVVEFEVVAYLGADVGAGATDDDVLAAVSAVGPAIELANINLPLETDSVEGILAGDIFHTGVIFGAPDESRAGLDIEGLVARILVDNADLAEITDLQALTGRYLEVVRTVADTLAAHGELLRAGDVIITGSVIPPVPVGDGSEFTFLLGSSDPISVRVG